MSMVLVCPCLRRPSGGAYAAGAKERLPLDPL